MTMTILSSRLLRSTFILLILLTISGCITTRNSPLNTLPPVLSLEELLRPYEKLGRIQVTREVYLADYSLAADIRSWGELAVRDEASKMGADAVILLEVKGRSTTSGIVPSTEYYATGFAIKFK